MPADSTGMAGDADDDCPGCGQPSCGTSSCGCGWHYDGGIVPLPELAEAAPL